MLNPIFPGIIPETFSISSGKITYLIPEVVGLSTTKIAAAQCN